MLRYLTLLGTLDFSDRLRIEVYPHRLFMILLCKDSNVDQVSVLRNPQRKTSARSVRAQIIRSVRTQPDGHLTPTKRIDVAYNHILALSLTDHIAFRHFRMTNSPYSPRRD